MEIRKKTMLLGVYSTRLVGQVFSCFSFSHFLLLLMLPLWVVICGPKRMMSSAPRGLSDHQIPLSAWVKRFILNFFISIVVITIAAGQTLTSPRASSTFSLLFSLLMFNSIEAKKLNWAARPNRCLSGLGKPKIGERRQFLTSVTCRLAGKQWLTAPMVGPNFDAFLFWIWVD